LTRFFADRPKLFPSLLILAVFLAGLTAWFTIAKACERHISIAVDDRVIQHVTMKHTLSAALLEAGIKVGPKDLVRPTLTSSVQNGMKVSVLRALPVKVIVDGKTIEVLTPPVTVDQVLKLANVTLGHDDLVSLPLDQKVKKSDEVTVRRVTEKTIAEQYALPVPSERREDNTLKRGYTSVVRAGVVGLGQRVMQVVYADGQEIRRSILSDQVINPAVSRIIAFGTQSTVSRGGNTIQFSRSLSVLSTAYSDTLSKYTSTGSLARYGVVAVDPVVIPIGSRLYVDGYGYATALDIGSAIKGNRIDLFFPTLQTCWNWGERWVKVYIIQQ
jgi:uncharacterized protein YabE (DUF348 family)